MQASEGMCLITPPYHPDHREPACPCPPSCEREVPLVHLQSRPPGILLQDPERLDG